MSILQFNLDTPNQKGLVMKNNRNAWNIFAVALAVLCLSAGAAAQSGGTAPKTVLVQPNVKIIDMGPSYTTSIVGDPDVTAAPYSAKVIEESVQTLADGNTITHKTTSLIYRDGQGRVRREQSAQFIGPMTVSGSTVGPPAQHEMLRILINDPVSGMHYVLNSETKVATETSGLAPISTESGRGGDNLLKMGTISVSVFEPSPETTTTESLGAQTMEGLTVTGTRVTRTIPAGQIGNAQPIQVITEQWYSADLQIMIMTKHSDPRTGTNTMQLTNVSRTEPDPSLFVVPPGYTIKTAGGRGIITYDVPQIPQND
jgi:hypothetical protein